jgi:hypothetical protein
VTLWALFAAAAIVAWRATTRRRDDVRLLEAIVNGSTDGVFRQGSRGPVPASAALAGLAPQHNVPGRVDDREALAGLRRDQLATRTAALAGPAVSKQCEYLRSG